MKNTNAYIGQCVCSYNCGQYVYNVDEDTALDSSQNAVIQSENTQLDEPKHEIVENRRNKYGLPLVSRDIFH